MTPADERMLQLLDRWRASLDLHTRYLRLPEEQYWLVQPWPQHERPTPWIVDLASQRLADLKRIVQSRVAAGDPSLSEALELMAFLANLVGSQHVQRYIPLVEPGQERPIESLLRKDSAAPSASVAPAAPPAAAVQDAAQPPAAAQEAVPQATPAADSVPVTEPAAPTVDAAPPPPVATQDMPADDDIVRDAVRLLAWGREWHELPGAISRMADRPALEQVREVLQARRQDIESRAAARSRHH